MRSSQRKIASKPLLLIPAKPPVVSATFQDKIRILVEPEYENPWANATEDKVEKKESGLAIDNRLSEQRRSIEEKNGEALKQVASEAIGDGAILTKEPSDLTNPVETEKTEPILEETTEMSTNMALESVDEEEEPLSEEEQRRLELKNLIRRLAVFPRVLERPYCEVTILGQKRIAQILSKRGDKVRIKYRNNKIETYDINDIEDVKILVGEN